jgi:transcriptional antiterminator NusG
MGLEVATNWYIIKVVSGNEQKVKEAILRQAEQKSILEKFADIIIPVENVTEIKRGKKVEREKKIFPGYIIVNMELNDLTWNIVKNIPRVSAFLGPNGKPMAIPEAEVKRIMQQIEESAVAGELEVTFDVGEEVKIIDGAFETFNGLVEEADNERQKLKVSVSIFGRSTPVELDFRQVEKIN